MNIRKCWFLHQIGTTLSGGLLMVCNVLQLLLHDVTTNKTIHVKMCNFLQHLAKMKVFMQYF